LLSTSVVTYFAETWTKPTSVVLPFAGTEALSTFATSVVPTYTWTGLSPTLVVLIHSKSRASQTSVAPIFTGSEKIVETSDAHVWASIFLSTSLVLVLTKSALHQRFGCWSGLHWNLTELAEILGENLKEFDLSQMCT